MLFRRYSSKYRNSGEMASCPCRKLKREHIGGVVRPKAAPSLSLPWKIAFPDGKTGVGRDSVRMLRNRWRIQARGHRRTREATACCDSCNVADWHLPGIQLSPGNVRLASTSTLNSVLSTPWIQASGATSMRFNLTAKLGLQAKFLNDFSRAPERVCARRCRSGVSAPSAAICFSNADTCSGGNADSRHTNAGSRRREHHHTTSHQPNRF